MPVPWPELPSTIPRPEERGITVQQLRELRLFLQRLCKTGLLRKDDKAINWHMLNQYHISELVLVPVISHLHFKQQLEGPPRRSWVEMVAAGPQKPQILMSHSWGGYFRDFMAVIDKVVADRGCSPLTPIWVCTFANSQFGENFGPTLEESPFFRAISVAEGTVLVVDREAGSLTRIWCGLELHFTDKLQKDLQVYTPSGRIGSQLVTSGPLVEAIAGWDVTCSEATQPSDRRQILNYLVNPMGEKNGLVKGADGHLVLEQGWRKLLEDDAKDATKMRTTGEAEYLHEAELFREHADAFSNLNQMVRNKVKEAICVLETSKTGCRINPIEQRRIMFGRLREFLKALKQEICAHIDFEYETVTTREVVSTIFKKRYIDVSHSEIVNDRPTFPTYIIEHLWDMRFSELVAGIEWFAEARQLSDTSAIWLDLAAYRHGIAGEMFRPEQENVLGKLNGITEGRAFLWPGNGVDINRAWFMHALHVTRKSAKLIDFVTSTGAVACSVAFPDGSWAFGNFDASIAQQLVELDANASKATEQRDLDMIFNVLRSAKGGFKRFQQRLCRIAAGPVIREAAARGKAEDISQILRLCGSSGLVINSSSLGGSLGEMATHVAAAAGHVEVLEALLNLSADPNAEDQINETPLHYAAFTGHLDCVKLLLSRSANVCAESAFGETPLDVASDNIAEFCGVETRSICTLLDIWAD